MPDRSRYKHPATGELYTPVTPEMLELIEGLKRRYGTWRGVAYHSKTKLKVLRNIRNGRRKAISMRLLDRILTETGSGSVEDYIWFTPDDLVLMGIWLPVQYVEGKKRVRQQSVRTENEHENGKPE